MGDSVPVRGRRETATGDTLHPVQVIEIDAEGTHPLRRSVLRDGTPSDRVVFDGDELATTFHLAICTDDGPVAIATWMERRYPDLPALSGYQLRGMATDPDHRGRGLASALVRDGIDRCARRGAQVVWARARVSALEFYERHGFEARGQEYVDTTTGLPHVDIVRPC
jgi:GNAT superfamily N-acetyltransferase